MKLIKEFVIVIVMLALTAGCAPKKIPEEKGERIPLSQVLTQTLKRYEDVKTLQSRLFVQLDLQDAYYILQGILLYERPARMRLRLTTNFGGTVVGEVIYNEGLLCILFPSKEKIFRGWIEEEENPKAETLFLTMVYNDYKELEGQHFPTRISGKGEEMEIRFNIKLKNPQVDLPLAEDAFIPATVGWEIHPLEDLKLLLQVIKAGAGP